VTRLVSVFSADLQAALANRGTPADLVLQPRDRISVFDLVSPRDRIVEPLMEEIRRQASPGAPAETVSVTGRVNAPGRYPLEPGMRIGDLLRAGGGLEDAAYAANAELTHYEIVSGEHRRADLREIDLAAVLAGDVGANVALQPYDLLTIKEMPEWGRVEEVDLVGELRFPGKYRIRRGESLASVVKRAGGLTTLAFPQGAVFTREELKTRERDQLDRLADRLQAEIATLSLQSAQTNPAATESLAAGQGLLEQLRAAKPVGRLVIDLNLVASEVAGRVGDVTLRGGDRLVVPRQTEEVTVLGEVQSPTSHLYKPGLTRDDLIRLSGGYTSRADKKRAYVVRANGSVEAGSSGWISNANVKVGPGDSVVVPIDAEKMRPLPMWTAITTIIYNLAIAATAIGRL
jgi:polysaccharide export outer membrane protein